MIGLRTTLDGTQFASRGFCLHKSYSISFKDYTLLNYNKFDKKMAEKVINKITLDDPNITDVEVLIKKSLKSF